MIFGDVLEKKSAMANVTNQNMTKSVFCRSVIGEGGCLAVGGKCRFAHTIEELRPKLCRYGERCNRHKDHPRTCKFVHPDESIYDYAKTHGFEKPQSSPCDLNTAVSISFTEGFPQLSNYPSLDGIESFDTIELSPLSVSDLECSSPLSVSDLDSHHDRSYGRTVRFDEVVRWRDTESSGVAILSNGV